MSLAWWIWMRSFWDKCDWKLKTYTCLLNEQMRKSLGVGTVRVAVVLGAGRSALGGQRIGVCGLPLSSSLSLSLCVLWLSILLVLLIKRIIVILSIMINSSSITVVIITTGCSLGRGRVGQGLGAAVVGWLSLGRVWLNCKTSYS